MTIPFRARLTGIDTEGQRFREETVLDNLSVGGLYLRLEHSVAIGSEVSVAVRLSTAERRVPALRLAARGKVLRTDFQPDGAWRVAMQFARRRVF